MKHTKSTYSGAIIGLGGLGCPALLGLVKAWPKDLKLKLKLLDADLVSLSNLNRQILFTENDVGKSKVLVAQNYFKNLNDIELNVFEDSINPTNMDDYLSATDFILDCSDDVELKLKLNTYSLEKNKLLIYAGVQGFEGITFAVSTTGICIKCVFGEFSSEEACELGGACQRGGILGSIAGITALIQIEVLLRHLFSPDTPKNIVNFINKKGEIRKLEFNQNSSCDHPSQKTSESKTIDLRKFNCPETFLYAKLGLEELKNCTEVEILLKNQSDCENVFESLKAEKYQKISKSIELEKQIFNINVTL